MAVKKGTTKRIDGKLMRWNGKKWVKSLRKVGGELTKRKSSALAKKPPSAITKAKSSAITKATKPGALTKQKSRAITNRRGRLVRSDTANTSRDTVRGKGTRTGQPGPNRKALKAGTQKALPPKGQTSASKSRTAARTASAARREAAKMKQTRAARGSGPTPGKKPIQGKPVSQLNRAKRWVGKNAPKAAKAIKKGGSKVSKLAARTGLAGKLAGRALMLKAAYDTGRSVFNPNDNLLLSVANLAQVARGKRSLGNSRSAQLRNARLDEQAMLADEAAVSARMAEHEAFNKKSLAQSNTPVVPTTPAGSRLPGESTAEVTKTTPKTKAQELDQWGRPKFYEGTNIERSNVFSKHYETGEMLGVMTKNQRKAYDKAWHRHRLLMQKKQK